MRSRKRKKTKKEEIKREIRINKRIEIKEKKREDGG